MSEKKPKIGKRQMKRISKSEVSDRFIRIGDEIDEPIHVEERQAGAVRYNVVKFLSEDNQAIVAVYGSMKHLCAVWVKEDTFATIRPLLPDDATVEDVAPFRRGFQWAIHIKELNSPLIPIIAKIATDKAVERMEKANARRADEARREVKRIERAKKKAQTHRDWKEL